MRKLGALLSLVWCMPAMADQFYVAAGFECNVNASELVIWFKGEWNEAGEALIANLNRQAIDPIKLVQLNQDEKGAYTVKTHSITQQCVIGGPPYLIEMAPLHSHRYKPEGDCATRVGARVKVSLRGKVIAERGVDACDETGTVTTKILIRRGVSPTFTDVTAEQFYADRN